jgi:glycosyltransferase involved in cell wall biosynthesis
LTALLEQLGLTDRFLLPGRATDVIPSLAALDIAVLCSASESFSNSLIEYMAAGLPVIASDVGGNCEAIRHGENGLLFQSGDREQFKTELRQLLTEPESTKRYAVAAREAARAKYSIQKYTSEHEAFYQRVYKERTVR